MNASTENKPGVLTWFRNLLRGSRTMQPSKSSNTQSQTIRQIGLPSGSIPGNFYLFEVFIEVTVDGEVHLGYPKTPIRDIGKTPPVLVWGSRIDLSYPKDATSRVRWVDDSRNGLFMRPHHVPEDWLGAEGAIGNMRLCFERILQSGKNQVVYSLLNPELGIRIAYGFSRKIFASGSSTN